MSSENVPPNTVQTTKSFPLLDLSAMAGRPKRPLFQSAHQSYNQDHGLLSPQASQTMIVDDSQHLDPTTMSQDPARTLISPPPEETLSLRRISHSRSNSNIHATPQKSPTKAQLAPKRKRSVAPTPNAAPHSPWIASTSLTVPTEMATPNPKPRKQSRRHARTLSEQSIPSPTSSPRTPTRTRPPSENASPSKKVLFQSPHASNPEADFILPGPSPAARVSAKSRRRSATPIIPPYEPPTEVFTPPREVIVSPITAAKSVRKSTRKSVVKKAALKVDIPVSVKKELPPVDLSLPMPPASPTDDPLLLHGKARARKSSLKFAKVSVLSGHVDIVVPLPTSSPEPAELVAVDAEGQASPEAGSANSDSMDMGSAPPSPPPHVAPPEHFNFSFDDSVPAPSADDMDAGTHSSPVAVARSLPAAGDDEDIVAPTPAPVSPDSGSRSSSTTLDVDTTPTPPRQASVTPDYFNFSFEDSANSQLVDDMDTSITPVAETLPEFTFDEAVAANPSADSGGWSDSDSDTEVGTRDEEDDIQAGVYTGSYRQVMAPLRDEPGNALKKSQVARWGTSASSYPVESLDLMEDAIMASPMKSPIVAFEDAIMSSPVRPLKGNTVMDVLEELEVRAMSVEREVPDMSIEESVIEEADLTTELALPAPPTPPRVAQRQSASPAPRDVVTLVEEPATPFVVPSSHLPPVVLPTETVSTSSPPPQHEELGAHVPEDQTFNDATSDDEEEEERQVREMSIEPFVHVPPSQDDQDEEEEREVRELSLEPEIQLESFSTSSLPMRVPIDPSHSRSSDSARLPALQSRRQSSHADALRRALSDDSRGPELDMEANPFSSLPVIEDPAQMQAQEDDIVSDLQVSDDDGEMSDPEVPELEAGVVKITSSDPIAAARAAAILQQHHYECFTKMEIRKKEKDYPDVDRFSKLSRRKTISATGIAKSKSDRATPVRDPRRKSLGVVSGDNVFIPGSPATTLRGLLDTVGQEIASTPRSTSKSATSRFVDFTTPEVATTSLVWSREDWKKLDACFTDERLAVGSDNDVAEELLDALAPVDAINLENVVSRFIEMEGGSACPWSRSELLQRALTLQKKQRAGNPAPPTTPFSPRSSPAADTPSRLRYDVPEFTPFARPRPSRAARMFTEQTPVQRPEFSRPHASLLAPRYASLLDEARAVSNSPSPPVRNRLTAVHQDEAVEDEEEEEDADHSVEGSTGESEENSFSTTETSIEVEADTEEVPATPSLTRRVSGLIFSYLPTLSSKPQKKVAHLYPGMPVPPSEVLNRPRKPVTTPARPLIHRPRPPKELVNLLPAPLPETKLSLIPRKPKRLVDLNHVATPLEKPRSVSQPRRSSGSVKDLMKHFEDMDKGKAPDVPKRQLLKKPMPSKEKPKWR